MDLIVAKPGADRKRLPPSTLVTDTRIRWWVTKSG